MPNDDEHMGRVSDRGGDDSEKHHIGTFAEGKV